MRLNRYQHALLILLAFIMPAMLAAQTHYEGNISVGGKAGLSLSRLNFNPTVTQTWLPGATFGGMFRYVEEKHFGIVAELNVEMRGWKETFENSDYNYQHRLTYIEFPVLTHIYFGSQRVHGFFNAGPEIAYMISDGASSNFDYTTAADIDYFEYNSRRIEQYTLPIKSRFDYGIAAGAGMEVFLSDKHSMLLEARFYYGLNDVFSNHKTDIFSGSNGMSLAVTLGYFFRIK